MTKMLEIRELSVNYGAIRALRDIDFHVNEGEIVSLIGANGAGKSTTLRTIMGLEKATTGDILFEGASIIKHNTQKIVSKGMTLVPEGRHVFNQLTVLENLELGAYLRKDKEGIQEDLKMIYERFPILAERKHQDAATLSGGEQQMLAMGRALMSKPKLLLLDEPSMGLAPLVIQEVFKIIKEINNQGTTILLIEQNAKQALSIADRGYVMETGRIIMTGTGQELMNDEAVQSAYLGG